MSDLHPSPSDPRPPPVTRRPPSPWSPPSSPLAALGDARVVALKVVGAVLLVVILGIGLLVYDSTREAAEVAELRELAAGGVAATPDDTPASLWVSAKPIGAVVLIDGDSVGTTPLWMESLAPGTYRVQVVGTAGSRLDTMLSVAAGAMAELDTNLRTLIEEPEPDAVAIADPPVEETPSTEGMPQTATTGTLRVSSSPAGAVVRLDGRRVGTTPVSLSRVSPGRRSVSVARGGYETSVQQIDIRPGVQFETVVDLRPVPQAAPPPREATPRPEPRRSPVAATGTVEILVRPWGRIVIDGETRERESDTVYRTTLSAGTHQVAVSHPQLGSDERTITVQPGGVARIEFDLSRGVDGP